MITCDIKWLEMRCRERGYTLDEVRPCILAERDGQVTVDVHHPAYPRTSRDIVRDTPPTDRQAGGPGTELKSLLKKWFGIEATPTCGCNAMAARMDVWGCDECANPERVTEVVNWMRAEHGRRAKAGRIHVPWSDLAAATMIRLAIRQARKKQAKAAQS